MSGLILLLGVCAIGLAPLVLGLAFMGKDRERAGVDRTIAAMERSYTGAMEKTAATPSVSLRERMGVPLANRLGELGTLLTPRGAVARLQRHLDYAGNPPSWPVERVVTTKGVGLVVGAIAVFLFLWLNDQSATSLVFWTLAGAAVGFFLPDVLIYNMGAKRQADLVKWLPDVLDTLTICVEAGQGFDAALAQVSRNGRGPMAGETARVLAEMRIGKSRTEALRAMAERTTVPELKGFASSVVQATELGVPMADVLREQAREMRLRRRQRAEEQAQKVPIKVLFPTLFCLFPALFVVVMGPAAINAMKSFSN